MVAYKVIKALKNELVIKRFLRITALTVKKYNMKLIILVLTLSLPTIFGQSDGNPHVNKQSYSTLIV